MFRPLKLSALALAAAISLAPAAYAAGEYNVSNGLTLAGNPLGIHGADPVAFLNSGAAVDGPAEFEHVHDGVEYYFNSAGTRDTFAAAPDSFLPQNGGFCTLGISVRKKLDGDTRYADVVDGKLYLFVNAQVFAAYQKDKAGTISKAAEVWEEIRSTPIEEL
ncbi:YHS domain-containing (seleno)protein [Roseobacter sp.]|uniref:YHS domain-containing (seleno)protein n=1 Tax=Roseobacter sp. TaxID=1907202 RepID=UPI00296639E1|nr:YHS domain-containing (seleno)protein [Roseobacter sp.]MDW3182786.1 YHS domain-containing (seleno)protein [Roseobacter sp.]